MKCEINARGLACPQPVVLTRNKMKECNHIEITVDNETAKENLKRLASSSGWSFEDFESGTDILVVLKSSAPLTLEKNSTAEIIETDNKTVVVFSSDTMGQGDDELGTILMKAFINTLAGNDTLPSKLVFYNSGVKLAAVGSGVTDDLAALQRKGTDLLICGTCVNYFNLKDNIHIGTISNMFDILDTMSKSSRLINP